VQLDEIADIVPVGKVFEPIAANRFVYDDLYGEFTKLYKQQKSMYHRLNRR
jgi:xylulokinase